VKYLFELRYLKDNNLFTAYVPVPFVTSHLRTPAQLEQVVNAQSTYNPDGSYVVPEKLDVGGLNLTPVKTGYFPQ
jgi:hypothetical protein